MAFLPPSHGASCPRAFAPALLWWPRLRASSRGLLPGSPLLRLGVVPCVLGQSLSSPDPKTETLSVLLSGCPMGAGQA